MEFVTTFGSTAACVEDCSEPEPPAPLNVPISYPHSWEPLSGGIISGTELTEDPDSRRAYEETVFFKWVMWVHR